MSRATNFLHVSEGFKLGSLGAGKKKFNDAPEISKSFSGSKDPNVREVEFGTNSIEWDENLSADWSHIFVKRPTWDKLEDYLVHFWFYMQRLDNEDRYQPMLEISLIDAQTDKEIEKFKYMNWFLTYKGTELALKWLQDLRPSIKKHGVKVLDFPDNWKKHK
jgi:hypothetical protein